MKYSTLLPALLLTGLIAGGIVFSGCIGKSDGSHSVSAPVPIKVYSVEKGSYVMSEAVTKTKETPIAAENIITKPVIFT